MASTGDRLWGLIDDVKEIKHLLAVTVQEHEGLSRDQAIDLDMLFRLSKTSHR